MTPQYKNNELQELPRINGARYENIFNVYTVEKDNKKFYFYNINNKIVLPTEISKSFLNTVTLDATLPWTTLSYKLYGNIYMWYILYTMNVSGSKPKFVANAGETITYIKPEFVSAITSKINE